MDKLNMFNNPKNRKMKEIKVQIPDEKELVWDKDLDAYKLVDADDIEQTNILKDFETDINNLYAKYHDRLIGKFSVTANIRFTAYHNGNRSKNFQWVEKTCAIDIMKGETNWHD